MSISEQKDFDWEQLMTYNTLSKVLKNNIFSNFGGQYTFRSVLNKQNTETAFFKSIANKTAIHNIKFKDSAIARCFFTIRMLKLFL